MLRQSSVWTWYLRATYTCTWLGNLTHFAKVCSIAGCYATTNLWSFLTRESWCQGYRPAGQSPQAGREIRPPRKKQNIFMNCYHISEQDVLCLHSLWNGAHGKCNRAGKFWKIPNPINCETINVVNKLSLQSEHGRPYVWRNSRMSKRTLRNCQVMTLPDLYTWYDFQPDFYP